MVGALQSSLWNDTSRFQYGWERWLCRTHLTLTAMKRYITSEAILFILLAGSLCEIWVSCSYAPRAFFPFWGHTWSQETSQAILTTRSLMPPPPRPVPILSLLWCQWWGDDGKSGERQSPLGKNCRQRSFANYILFLSAFLGDFQDIQILSGTLVLCL